MTTNSNTGSSPVDRRVGRRLTPHQKIMRAAKRKTGLRLTSAEVWALSCDSAIETRGTLDDSGNDENDDLPHPALTANA